MTVTVNFTGLEPIADALNNLAKSLGASGFVTTVKEKPSATVAPQVVQPAPVPSAAPPAPPAAPPAPQPAQPVQPTPVPSVPAPIPTAPASYTLDDLARAAMTLMDSGKQAALMQLLQGFGVEALPSLPQSQYGAFAVKLREMGAQI